MDPIFEGDPTKKKPPDEAPGRISSQAVVRAQKYAEARLINRETKLKLNAKKAKKKGNREVFKLKIIKGTDHSKSGKSKT